MEWFPEFLEEKIDIQTFMTIASDIRDKIKEKGKKTGAVHFYLFLVAIIAKSVT